MGGGYGGVRGAAFAFSTPTTETPIKGARAGDAVCYAIPAAATAAALATVLDTKRPAQAAIPEAPAYGA